MNEYELPWDADEGRSLAQKLAARTAKRIVQGELAPGDLLTEVELSMAEGVSRTPAREAMLQLQTWGLVKLIPKKGGTVTTVTAAQRSELIDVRATWEIRSVQLLAHDPQQRAELAAGLREILGLQHQALVDGNLLAFARWDVKFHLRIIQAAGNSIIAGLLEHLGPRLARLTVEANNHYESSQSFRAEHEALAQLIAAGDLEGFTTAVREHVHHGIFGKNN